MSVAVTTSASFAAIGCACGSCAACAPRRVAEAPAVSVAEAATPSARTDRYEPSGLVPLADQASELDSTAAPTSTGFADDVESAGVEPKQESKNGEAHHDKPAGRGSSRELTPEERQMVTELQLRDREVRAHEAAHKAAGGAYVGGASYTYQQGPDGRQYAIGGEVPVDLSTGGGSPEAIIAKMEQVRAAALAPGDPSSQDYAVAAAADAIATQARRDQQAAESDEAQAKDDQRASNATNSGQPILPGQGQNKGDPLSGANQSQEEPTLGQSRAIGAYRKAQGAQLAQGLLNQVA